MNKMAETIAWQIFTSLYWGPTIIWRCASRVIFWQRCTVLTNFLASTRFGRAWRCTSIANNYQFLGGLRQEVIFGGGSRRICWRHGGFREPYNRNPLFYISETLSPMKELSSIFLLPTVLVLRYY